MLRDLFNRIFGRPRPSRLHESGEAATWSSRCFWDSVEVPVPSDLHVEADADGTQVLYRAGEPDATIRLSMLSFQAPDGRPFAGQELVLSRAAESGHHVQRRQDGVATSHYVELGTERETPLEIHYWNIGLHDELVILSLTLVRATRSSEWSTAMLTRAKRMADELSFRRTVQFVETSSGTIPYRVESLPSGELKQTVRAFEDAEHEWLRDSLARFEHVSAQYVRDVSGSNVNDPSRKLDAIFSAWQHDQRATKPTADDIANALAARFGEHLRHTYGMKWVVIADEYGEDKAVRADRNAASCFPLNVVQKRIESGASNFCWPVEQSLRSIIEA